MVVRAKHDLLGRFEQKDDKSELMTRETSSGSLVYTKPETVMIESNLQGEECPGAYTGQWVSLNILTDPSVNLSAQG